MRYLLVDGHSIIFAWPELKSVHSRRSGAGRDELIRRLTRYQDASGVHVVVVFDGRGPSKMSDESEPGGIQILYSGAGVTADTIIERLCARYGSEHELTVATDDHMEQQTALTFGAVAISSETLRQILDDAGSDLQKRIKRQNK
jgi:predicted RNA-binding protein with PIN domain